MLIIRNEQMQVLATEVQRAFAARVVAHLASALPLRFGEVGDAGVRTLVDRGIALAFEHGIAMERDVTALIEAMLGLGADFDALLADGWVGTVLRHPALSGAAKGQMLRERMMSVPVA
jgi:hypothetical protein